jgi:protein disulfide-isomerase
MKAIIRLGVASVCLAALSAWAGAGWEDDFEKGLETAKKENKYVLVDFSGSDWCGWCIRLDEEVFSKKPFKDYAKENLVTVLVDFPRKKKIPKKQADFNRELAGKFNVQGYPTVLLLNSDGVEIARTGYKPGGPEEYVKHLQDLIAKAKAGAK